MLKLFLFALSIFLITIIFLRVPKESTGLKSNMLGAPSSSEKSLNILTSFGILLYLILAVIANSSK